MELVVTPLGRFTQASHDVEIVERKGLGHPDTICDALAEQLSVALCRYYLEHFDLVLHHNVDKVLLWGGVSRAAFGAGEIVAFFIADLGHGSLSRKFVVAERNLGGVVMHRLRAGAIGINNDADEDEKQAEQSPAIGELAQDRIGLHAALPQRALASAS